MIFLLLQFYYQPVYLQLYARREVCTCNIIKDANFTFINYNKLTHV